MDTEGRFAEPGEATPSAPESNVMAAAISVLMPVYNAERHLAAALESVLNQSFRDFEFLIIDDGSTV